MKKLVCLLLVLVFCLGTCAFAEDAIKSLPEQLEGVDSGARLFDPDDVDEPDRSVVEGIDDKKTIDEAPESEDKAITSDIVLVNNNDYTVVTTNGIMFHYRAPENVYVFTQDLSQQGALYAACYQSPSAVVDQFIQNRMHFNIYDAASGTDIYLYCCNTYLASMYNNSASLTNEEAQYIASYMLTDKDYMLNCSDIVYGWAGGNMWFVGDRRAYDGYVVLSTFVGGMEVWSCVKATSDADYNRIIDLLDYLTISY